VVRRCFLAISVLFLPSGSGGLAFASERAEAAAVQFASGATFRKAIELPISATWENVNLRTIVRAIEGNKRVAILCDRRIDPTAELFVSASGEPLGDFLERLAAGSRAGGTIVGNTMYLGPRATASRLRTVVALRKQELLEKSLGVPESRRNDLLRASTIRWEDFDKPADILSRLSEKYSLAVERAEWIPHDLWAGAVLPEATPIEALSLVLAQFDLTFAWTGRGEGIRLATMPERVVMEQGHLPPRGKVAAAALADWKEKIPDLEARVEGGKVVVSGTVEIQEMIDRLRRGGTLPEKKTAPREVAPLKPLKFERYTLKMQNTPASSLLKKLESPDSGKLTFEYDEDEFKAASISLDKLLSFDVKNATIEELLKATFDPLGVTFEIVDRTVKLKPAGK
jgi:hypothetical protein